MHLAGVLPEHVDALGLGLHDLKSLQDPTDDGRSQRSGEDKATSLVLHKLDHLIRTGDESTHRAEGLGKCSHDNLDIIIDPEMMSHTSSMRPNYSKRMGLVDIHNGSIFLGSFHHRRKISHVTRHAKNAIHDDKTAGFLRDALEAIAEGFHGVMPVRNQLGRRYLTPLNDRGMVLTVAENEVVSLCQCCKSTLVRKESGGKKKGTFTAKERRERLFQLIMERDGSIQKTGTRASGTKLARRLAGCLNNAGVLGQAKVVVGPDHDLLFAATDDMISVALLNAAEIRVESLRPGICRIAVLSALLEEVFGHCYWL